MHILIALVAFFGGIGLLILLCDLGVKGCNKVEKKLEEYAGEEEWAKIKQEIQEEKDMKMYNNFMFTCPMCGSKKVKKIDTLNRALSISVKGLASDKIGKQYQCDHCGHKF